jgi:hypothetical protein
VDGCRLRPAHNVERHRLVSLAAEAADLKIEISSVQGVAQRRRGLSRAFESKHSLVPSDTRQTVGFLPSLGRTLRRMPNRTAVDALARFRAHSCRMRQPGVDRQAATAGLGTACTPLLIVDVEESGRPRGSTRAWSLVLTISFHAMGVSLTESARPCPS